MFEWSSLAVPAVSAILGGAATYGVTTSIQRARPRIGFQGCTLSTELAANNRPVVVDYGLILQCDRTPEIPFFLDRNSLVDEERYISFLTGALNSVRTRIERRQDLKSAAEELQRALSAGLWDNFRSKWADENESIWAALMYGFKTGSLALAPIAGDSFEEPSIGSYESSLIVSIKDGRKIYFTYEEEDAEELQFCTRAAYALKNGLQGDLQVMINNLNSYISDDRLDRLRDNLLREKDKFTRVVVTGHVANTGRLPCSVSNTARIFVRTAGQPAPQKTPNGTPTTPSNFPEDLQLDVLLGAQDMGEADVTTPVVVPAGGLVPFSAMSDGPLSDHANGDDLLRSLKNGSLKAYLGYQVSLPGKGVTMAYSDDFAFLDSGNLQQIHERPSKASRFGRGRA